MYNKFAIEVVLNLPSGGERRNLVLHARHAVERCRACTADMRAAERRKAQRVVSPHLHISDPSRLRNLIP